MFSLKIAFSLTVTVLSRTNSTVKSISGSDGDRQGRDAGQTKGLMDREDKTRTKGSEAESEQVLV